MLMLSSQRPQEHTIVEKAGFIAHFSKGKHPPWGTLVCVSKRVLERAYYSTWALVGWFGRGSKKAGVCSGLNAVRKQWQICNWISVLIASYWVPPSPCDGQIHNALDWTGEINRYLFIPYTYSRGGGEEGHHMPHRATWATLGNPVDNGGLWETGFVVSRG